MDSCIKCQLLLEGNRTLLQCWRIDTPAGISNVSLMEEYCEIFSVCMPCADIIDKNHQQRIIIDKDGHSYFLDRMFDVKDK